MAICGLCGLRDRRKLTTEDTKEHRGRACQASYHTAISGPYELHGDEKTRLIAVARISLKPQRSQRTPRDLLSKSLCVPLCPLWFSFDCFGTRVRPYPFLI